MVRTKYEKALHNYISSFECNECDNSGQSNFLYDRTVANGECWTCKQCKKENLFNEEPREENFEKSMEQQIELDYMISVMQSAKEGKEIEFTPKDKKDKWFGNWTSCYKDSLFNFIDYKYRVKPEPPKTEKFTFADADFLAGLKVKSKNWTGIITKATVYGVYNGHEVYKYEETGEWSYQDPKTEEWKPFLKEVKE